MDFTKLNQALERSYEAFTAYIEEELQKNKNVLLKTIWDKGEFPDVLTYLIRKQNDQHDFSKHIRFLIEKGANTSLNQPVHLILKERKFTLLPILLQAKNHEGQVNGKLEESDNVTIDTDESGRSSDFINGRDAQGRTILSLAVETGDIECLKLILQSNPSPLINQADEIKLAKNMSRKMQPLHLAVYQDFSAGVEALIAAGADCDEPFGNIKRPALSIAARAVSVNAMAVILASNHRKEQLNYQDDRDIMPIDLLCDSLEKGQKSQEAIRGVAMLLCRGADAPRAEKYRDLLRVHREALLDEVIQYTEKNPRLKLAVLRTIHDKNHPLHRIIYDPHSLKRTLKSIVGGYDGLAGRVESLAENVEGGELTPDEQHYKQFIAQYLKTLNSTFFFNRWSGMLAKISQGEITCWQEVRNYAHENRGSRTSMIVEEIDKVSSDPIHLHHP